MESTGYYHHGGLSQAIANTQDISIRSQWYLGVIVVAKYFFFQAEDGIRDDLVTGVQTCALPICCLLFLVGLITAVRSRFVERVHLSFNMKNIAIILSSLCGFVVISEHLNMILGILFMVFCASSAGASYSVIRNLAISARIIVVDSAFQKLLGVNLPLY